MEPSKKKRLFEIIITAVISALSVLFGTSINL